MMNVGVSVKILIIRVFLKMIICRIQVRGIVSVIRHVKFANI